MSHNYFTKSTISPHPVQTHKLNTCKDTACLCFFFVQHLSKHDPIQTNGSNTICWKKPENIEDMLCCGHILVCKGRQLIHVFAKDQLIHVQVNNILIPWKYWSHVWFLGSIGHICLLPWEYWSHVWNQRPELMGVTCLGINPFRQKMPWSLLSGCSTKGASPATFWSSTRLHGSCILSDACLGRFSARLWRPGRRTLLCRAPQWCHGLGALSALGYQNLKP
jgi:hypothetical protein